MYDLGSGFYVGETVYSAAFGDAGGLFIGGVELAKRFSLGGDLSLEFGVFVGGGGGAAVVNGNGMMTRANATLIKRFSPGWAATLGVSYIDITGTSISTPAIGFGISRTLDMKVSGSGESSWSGADGAVEITSIKPVAKVYFPQNSRKRSGGVPGNMMLLGAEMTFSSASTSGGETFVSAAGAVAGDGEGYAEYQLGYRWLTGTGRLRAYAQLAAGFAGGGDIDTGGGLIASGGVGVIVPFSPRFSVEIGVTGVTALDGNFTAISPFIGGAFTFGGTHAGKSGPTTQRWQLSTGLTAQQSHPGFRNPGSARSGSPVLVEASVDLFLTRNFYFTGNAQTAISGDAGGYAVGQFGIGYEIPVSTRWTISPEIYVGAAGGGAVNTGGGLIAGGRVELDYALNDTVKLSLGLGKFVSRGGAAPLTAHLGLKIPFTSFH
jgi:hypothetical protein